MHASPPPHPPVYSGGVKAMPGDPPFSLFLSFPLLEFTTKINEQLSRRLFPFTPPPPSNRGAGRVFGDFCPRNPYRVPSVCNRRKSDSFLLSQSWYNQGCGSVFIIYGSGPRSRISKQFLTVWRIRDVYPGSRIRLFSIPDPGSELSPSRIPDPHQRI